jgi:hypothetical protein
MIELLERQDIFKLNETFASFIADVQDAKYNPTLDYNKYEPCEMYVDESEELRFVSQQECDEWNSKAFEEHLKNKDNISQISIKERHAGEIAYNFPHDNMEKYIENLANGIVELSNRLQWKAVIFLLDYSTPWLHQDNDYKPVKKALDYLKKIGTSTNFNGGFKASGQDLKELTTHLFWIIRCNAALPDCYFSGVDKDFTADICKYGNIHFHFYSDKDKLEIQRTAEEIGMIGIEDGQCFENFSETSAIDGRQIII